MEFIGNLKQLVGERSGDGQNGPWRINQYLLETVDMYPKRMVVEVRDNIALWDTLIGKNVLNDLSFHCCLTSVPAVDTYSLSSG